MTRKIGLVTDITSDIPAEWIQHFNIAVVPMTVVFGDEELVVGKDINAKQFYERMRSENVHPTTSQPVPGDFQSVFQSMRDKGAQEILCITISEAQSGTFKVAQQAAAEADFPVTVVNSRNNSMGLGWQVIAAARAREEGAGLKEMVAQVKKIRGKMAYYILLDTIEYLSKGGRIGEAVNLLDSLLKIKPLVHVKADTGAVGVGLPARSRKSGKRNLFRVFFKRMDPSKPLHIAVLHNDVQEEAEALAEQVRVEFDPDELIIGMVNPILGAHTGPGAIALCGYSG